MDIQISKTIQNKFIMTLDSNGIVVKIRGD